MWLLLLLYCMPVVACGCYLLLYCMPVVACGCFLELATGDSVNMALLQMWLATDG